MAKYLKNPQNEGIYTVAQLLWQQCFLHDDSLLFEGPLWTLHNLQSLHESFVVNPDESKDKKFLEKLQGQIGQSEKPIIRLAAELLCLYYLFPSATSISGQTKCFSVNTVLSWCDDTIPTDHPIVAAFDCGIGGTGTAYNTLQFWELAWLLEAAIAFKKLPPTERKDLNEPWGFLSFIDSVPMQGKRQSRHTLLHLFFPDTFERIATLGDKEAIVTAFDSYATEPHEEIDKKLFEIRKALEKKYNNSNLDFYNPPLKNIWRPEPAPQKSLEEPFKDWLQKQGKSDGKKYSENTVYQYVRALKSATKKLEGANIAHSNLFFYTTLTTFEAAYKCILEAPNYGALNSRWANGTYAASMERYRAFLAEREGQVQAPYKDVQAPDPDFEFSYTLQNIRDEGCFVEDPILRQMFDRLQNKKNLILQGPPGTGKTWLAKRLAYALVGKTDSEQVRSMQFHATLSYEDFICGWRPAGEGKLELLDGPFLEIVEQAKKNPRVPYVMVIEEINRGNPAQIFGEMLTLLEADKRKSDEKLRLCYQKSGENRTVYIPENLYLIGTMNVADRSLAIVDFALRRRFAFFDLKPVFDEPWQKWMRERAELPQAAISQIAQNMLVCNEKIASDMALGPQYAIGHSFVTSENSIEDYRAWFKAVLETELVPLLREYWFDTPTNVEDAIAILKEGILD